MLPRALATFLGFSGSFRGPHHHYSSPLASSFFPSGGRLPRSEVPSPSPGEGLVLSSPHRLPKQESSGPSPLASRRGREEESALGDVQNHPSSHDSIRPLKAGFGATCRSPGQSLAQSCHTEHLLGARANTPRAGTVRMPANTQSETERIFPPRAGPLPLHPLLSVGSLGVSAPEKLSGAYDGEKPGVGFPPWPSLQGHL